MKKRLVIVLLAMVLVISSCCFALVGCAGNEDTDTGKDSGNSGGNTEVTFETPAQFIDAWFKSTSKAYMDSNRTFGVDGDKYCRLFDYKDDKEFNYSEVVGDNVYSYSYEGDDHDGTWFTGSMSKVDYFRDENDSMLKMFNDNYKENLPFEVSDEEFKNNFTLQDGWYIGSGDFANFKFKISAKELVFGDIRYGDEDNEKFVIGFTIEIPQEGKDAFEKNEK